MKIKICGLTNFEDTQCASSLEADYLGFIFYPPSPRNNSPENVKKILERLNTYSEPVAVFVNENMYKILEITSKTSIKTVQLHGDEDDHFVHVLKNEGLKVIKVHKIKNEDSFKSLIKFTGPDYFLLDTWHPCYQGGSGECFDWNLLKGREMLVESSFIAGGITPKNISSLIEEFNPFAVDVSSGVEGKPGKKDHKKMKLLFEAAGRKY